MTNYRAILQYHYRGNTTTQIAKLCECSRTTVLKTIKRAKECGIDEPAFELLSDIQLLETLYPKRVHRTGYEEPDFIALEKDKKKRGLTVFVKDICKVYPNGLEAITSGELYIGDKLVNNVRNSKKGICGIRNRYRRCNS